MLAYMFWHWPRPGVDLSAYERGLRTFHAALSENGPGGFLRSVVFRTGEAPWLPRRAYVDWYLVEGSAILDPLNEAAVAGANRLPHDDVARHVDGASAGLYRLRFGELELEDAAASTWFSKPSGVPLADFCDEVLRPLTEGGGGALWARQMGLGTTPELCLLGPAADGVPADLGPVRVELELIWSREARSGGV